MTTIFNVIFFERVSKSFLLYDGMKTFFLISESWMHEIGNLQQMYFLLAVFIGLCPTEGLIPCLMIAIQKGKE